MKKAHFGGEDGENGHGMEEDDDPDRVKSKKEIMSEIIAKSKQGKMERQKAKQEDEELLDKLNHDFTDVKALLMGGGAQESHGRGPAKPLDLFKKGDDDDVYDRIVRELASEKRAHPTDRMKTSMELAKEEKTRLEALEEDRLRRMAGITEMEDDTQNEGRLLPSSKLISGDDLEGNYVLDGRSKNTALTYHQGRLVGGRRDLLGNFVPEKTIPIG